MKRSLTIVLTTSILLIVFLLFWLGVFAGFQHRLADALYSNKAGSPTIVIIGIDDQSLQAVGRWPWSRGNFSVLLDRLYSTTSEPAVVGFDIAFLEKSNPLVDEALGRAVQNRSVVLVSEYTGFSQDPTSTDGAPIGVGLLSPTTVLHTTTTATGYSNIVTDDDGVARAMNLRLGSERAFSAAVYETYIRIPNSAPQSTRYLINFAGAPGAFTRYSAADVIDGKIPAEAFKGKIVLIGAVARDFHDDAIVPTSGGVPMPGVEVHANAIQTMLLSNELHNVASWINGLLVLLVIIIIAVLIDRQHIAIVGGIALGMIVLYIALALFMFERGWIMNLVYVPFAIVFSFIVLACAHLVVERASRRRVSDAFGKYVSPALLEQIMQQEVRLGGERRELSILFSDVRGFTTLSESMSPEQLVEFLNEYFERATNAILANRGLVDKFIGDAIMAFWNAPITDEEHADHAVLCALAMRSIVEQFNKSTTAPHGEHRLRIGIGINTGEAVVGNVGSTQRLSYTAMGDSVNLASRLEGLTKEYGVDILISQSTVERLRGSYVLREIDSVKVKGRKKAVVVYEVITLKAGDATYKHIEQYDKGLRLYYEGKFTQARKIFQDLAEHDGPSRTMMERCSLFERDPPTDWDGSFTMEHK